MSYRRSLTRTVLHRTVSAVTLTILFVTMFCIPGAAQSQWTRQDVLSDASMLLTMDFKGVNVGAAAGYVVQGAIKGRAIYTSDGGTIWIPASVPDSARSLVTVTLIDGTTGYIAGAYDVPIPAGVARPKRPDDSKMHNRVMAIGIEGYLNRIGMDVQDDYRGLFLATTDGGQSWFTKGVLPANIYYLLGASFLNAKLGYVTGDADPTSGMPRILKTTDGGDTWSTLATPGSLVVLRNISFVDSLTGVAVGARGGVNHTTGVILRTSDAGATWSSMEFPTVDNFTDVCFLDTAVGFSVGIDTIPNALDSAHGAIYKTTDGGLSWSHLAYQPDTTLVEGVRFARGTGTGMIFGNRFSLNNTHISTPVVFARTTDFGATWTEVNVTVDSGKNVWGGKLVTPLVGYLCGGDWTNGALMLGTQNGGITGVHPGGDRITSTFELRQNYPNPFNPTTLISYDLPASAHVRLTVFDLLGREVRTLVDEVQREGSKSVEFNAQHLPSGVYFYRLQAGSFMQTKKLLLMR
jgi:photosystem II stability/assembly factor-like uncharacterized protein